MVVLISDARAMIYAISSISTIMSDKVKSCNW